MGDQLKHEFSMDPVDTGRMSAPIQPQGVAPGESSSLATPGQPITRPSFLQSFLANLGPALAGGLANSGDPRFPFGTGLPGAISGIQNHQEVQFQQQFQQRQQAMQQQAQASTQAYQQAETSRLNQITPLDVREKQMNADLLQAQIGFYSNPGNLDNAVADATKTLGKLEAPEQAQLNAAKQDAKLKRSFDPISNAVKTIAQDRFQESKADQTSGYTDYKNDPTIDKGVKNKNRATFLSWKAKQNPMAVIAGNMLPPGQALDQQAELYSQTHEIPSGLSRSPGTITAIINRSAQLHPDQVLATNQATFKADQTSLTNLQKNFDQVTAFENTAIKNLDQVAKTGAKVPDLSTRLANMPVRSIDSKVLGTKEMAAFRTALLTAQNEAAKVLTSANASGVLSDSARKEAQDVLDGNLPFPAMMASINQLKTDFGNRHTSYQEAINAIKGRMGNKPGSPPAGANVIKLEDFLKQ